MLRYIEPGYCDCVEYDKYAICYNNQYPGGIRQNYGLKEECLWYDYACLWNEPYLFYVKPYYYPACNAYPYCDIWTPQEYHNAFYYDDYYYDVAAGIFAGAAFFSSGALIADSIY